MSEENNLEQTPETVVDVPAPVEEQVIEPAVDQAPITRERFDAINADPDSATPEEMEAIKPYVLGDKEFPELPVEAAVESDADREAREANEAAAGVGTDPAADLDAAMADEDETPDETVAIAQAEQATVADIRTKHKAELARLDAIIDEKEPERNTDEWDEWDRKTRTALRDRSRAQEKYQDDLEDARSASRAKVIADREAAQVMKQFDKVASKHPEVALKRPFKDANAEYAAWLGNLAANSGLPETASQQEKVNAGYTKFKADPEFAKKVPAPKDVEQTQILNEAHALVQAAGGKRTLDGAVLEVLATRGALAKRVTTASQAASQAAAKRTQEALGRAAAAPITAPAGGKTKTPTALQAPADVATAERYLTNLLDKKAKGVSLTEFETKYEAKAKELIGLSPVR